MLGLVVQGRMSRRGRKLRYGGVTFFAVPVLAGEGVLAKLSAHRAAHVLARAGVQQAVFPKEYCATEVFAGRGIRPPDPAQLHAAAAAQIALAALGDAAAQRRVVLVGKHATREICAAARALCTKIRYLAAALSGGEEPLARMLLRDYGVAMGRCESPRQCAPTDLALCFAPREGWEAGEIETLALYDPALAVEYAWPEHLTPGSFDPTQMLAALVAAGVLNGAELVVRRVGQNEKNGKSPAALA